MARLPLAGRRPGYPVFTSLLSLVVPGNTELFFFFPKWEGWKWGSTFEIPFRPLCPSQRTPVEFIREFHIGG